MARTILNGHVSGLPSALFSELIPRPDRCTAHFPTPVPLFFERIVLVQNYVEECL